MMPRYFVSDSGSYLGSFDGPDDEIPAFLYGGFDVGVPPDDARQVWKDGVWLPLELPVSFLPVSRRQLRLTLIREGISLASVEALISQMPDGQEKEEAEVEWESDSFDRQHPTLLLIAEALHLTPAKVDEMWLKAMVA